MADVLDLAASKLRSGEGWDEGTTGDVLREVLHAYPNHASNLELFKKANIMRGAIWRGVQQSEGRRIR